MSRFSNDTWRRFQCGAENSLHVDPCGRCGRSHLPAAKAPPPALQEAAPADKPVCPQPGHGKKFMHGDTLLCMECGGLVPAAPREEPAKPAAMDFTKEIEAIRSYIARSAPAEASEAPRTVEGALGIKPEDAAPHGIAGDLFQAACNVDASMPNLAKRLRAFAELIHEAATEPPRKEAGAPGRDADLFRRIDKHLTDWLDQDLCECESGHICGKSEVTRTRNDLRARMVEAPAPSLTWTREWPDEVLYLGKEIRAFTGLLAEYQTNHEEAAGKGGCKCKLCKRYDKLPWSLFLPPSDDPYHREMEAGRRAKELGLTISPTGSSSEKGHSA